MVFEKTVIITKKTATAALLAGLLVTGTPALSGQGLTSNEPVRGLEGVGVDQRLNAQVSPELVFIDENGGRLKLGKYFGKKPILLTLVYYECPMLCGEVLNGVLRALRAMSFQAGKEFDILTVSIDPDETAGLASEKKAQYLEKYGRSGAEEGWHFLTGDQEAIRELTGAVGFRYKYVPEIDQFSHAAAILLLTPRGRVSRYFFGIEFAPRDLRLSVIEASRGRVGTALDQVLLYCFQYDPSTGRYSVAILNILRAGGIITLALVAAFVLFSLRHERRASTTVPERRPLKS